MRASTKDFELARYYDDKEGRVEIDKTSLTNALNFISVSIQNLIRENHEQFPTGWDGADMREIGKFLSSDPISVKDIENKLVKKMFGSEAKGEVGLGASLVKFTTQDFGKWCPAGDQFTRGDYVRNVWSEIYSRCKSQLAASQG
jgi:hypothetical protein